MASAGARAYYRSLGRSPQRGSKGQSPRWGVTGLRPLEAESSVAFEAPAEEPNLSLVTDSFCSSYRETLMFISRKFGKAKTVVFGEAKFATWGLAPNPPFVLAPA